MGIGLLDEGGDLHHRADTLAAGTDVAVVGLGLRRRDAEGDDAAFLDGGETFTAAGEELLGADHQMVGRQRQHGLGAEPTRVGRSGGHGGTRVAARRFDQDVDVDADVLGLAFAHEAIGVVGRDHGLAEKAAVGDAQQRLLKGRLRAEQGDELLGHALARQGPQALAGAPPG